MQRLGIVTTRIVSTFAIVILINRCKARVINDDLIVNISKGHIH